MVIKPHKVVIEPDEVRDIYKRAESLLYQVRPLVADLAEIVAALEQVLSGNRKDADECHSKTRRNAPNVPQDQFWGLARCREGGSRGFKFKMRVKLLKCPFLGHRTGKVRFYA